jgi:NADH:ubiquinone oxidoreductase subunit F (NADH-binding)/NADH:ubiquinone oxidoreductase subunit E
MAARSIVQELYAIQKRCGYLPKPELQALARRLRTTPLHRIHEVASFFPHFRLDPPPPLEVKVCRDMACHLRGADEYQKNVVEIAEELASGEIVVEGVSCLGRCDGAPAVLIGEHVYRAPGYERIRSLMRAALQNPGESPARAATQFRTRGTISAGIGATGWRIDPYAGREDYEAVRRYAATPDSDALIEQLKIGDLRGMGGAGVWAHQKWRDVRDARGDTKYCVVNADESEPGTFKDRELLLQTPQLVIEGLILAGLVTGAERGYIYIRHEYEEAIEIVRAAILRAEALGVCGDNVLGTGKSYPVEVFVSPGGYICGEQSALIEAMEDHRAEPRNKPPMLETNGLYNKPTLVSNVETYAWVPAILIHGGAWYREQGVNGANGLRFFSISGDVNNPGVYEVPSGITLRSLIEDHAGGILEGQVLKAFAPSGPSAGFLPARLPRARLPEAFAARLAERERARAAEAQDAPAPSATEYDLLDLELDLQTMREMGLMLGAGLVVYGDKANMLDQALNACTFFRNESCGKCVPCRLGSEKIVEMAGGILKWQYDEETIKPVEKLLTDLQRTMELTSICGLGMVAGNPLISIFRSFRQDLEPYLRSGPPTVATGRTDIGGTMGDVTGLLDKLPIKKRPIRPEMPSEDFEILGEPGHE